MTQQIISTGNMANDHRGDSLRTAGSKINDNFTEVYIASQGAYDQANTSFALAQTAFDKANTDTGDIIFQGSTLYSTTDAIELYSHVAGGIEGIILRAKGDAGDNTITFRSDGTLTVPGVITGTETAPTWTHNITAISLGAETLVTFDVDEFSAPIVGQVIISDVGGTTQINGTWWYQAWENNQVKLFTDNTVSTAIDSTTWGEYAGGGTITNLDSGGVSIQANGDLWDFKADGSLKVPGDIIVGSSPNPSGKEQHYIVDATNYWTSIQWKNMTSLQTPNATPFECQAQLLRVFANDNTVTAWCNLNNPREELVAVTAVRENNTHNGLMISTSDGKIPDAPYNDGQGTRYNWIFGGDGELTLPTGGRLGFIGKGWTGLDGGNGSSVSVTSLYSSGMYSSCLNMNPDGTLSINTYGDGTGLNGQWYFNGNSLTLPGPINNIIVGVADKTGTHDSVYPTEIDLTKTINKLGDNSGSWYTLADGVEGQIMHLVRKHDVTDLSYASIHVLVANAYYGLNQLTNQNLYFNGEIITLIFTDGAWQQTGGTWD